MDRRRQQITMRFSRAIGAWDHWDGIVGMVIIREASTSAAATGALAAVAGVPLFDRDNPNWTGSAQMKLVIDHTDMDILTHYLDPAHTHSAALRDTPIPDPSVPDPNWPGRTRYNARTVHRLTRLAPAEELSTIVSISLYHLNKDLPKLRDDWTDANNPWEKTGAPLDLPNPGAGVEVVVLALPNRAPIADLRRWLEHELDINNNPAPGTVLGPKP